MHPKVVRLLTEPNYVVLTTFTPSGDACSHMMWASCDSQYVYINTEVHRGKYRNMRIGSKTTILVFENDRSWAEIRGRVKATQTGDSAKKHLNDLSFKYNGHAYRKQIDSDRVVVTIDPYYEYIYKPERAHQSWDR
jgi:hypothetical protein